ncbi:MAG: DNA adenine methylase [Candidatus Omnitrophica bacterium]|nr:DNA adenine methylase [Candidatus Omnitrophota bacterium]
MATITNQQLTLIEDKPKFPSTRFQGSKLKIVDWICDSIKNLDFNTVLDAFGGTGSVGYKLKQQGKKVTYNDILKFNWYIGLALIENDRIKLSGKDIDFLLARHNKIRYPTFVYDTFKDVYFTDEENQWIDVVVTNIGKMENLYKMALAYYALFQSCIIKRPFNLFHRKNLYLRFSEVERNFGNKTTWDTPFETHFRKFITEANQAVFSSGLQNKAFNLDVFDIEGDFDLVYIDTPYISKKGIGVDYFGFYHFLEGLVRYSKWGKIIDCRTKHKKLKGAESPWINKNKIYSAFERLFEKFKDSILVISYRADGIPSIDELVNLLKKYKANVKELRWKNYRYVLSNNHTSEVLLIGI